MTPIKGEHSVQHDQTTMGTLLRLSDGTGIRRRSHSATWTGSSGRGALDGLARSGRPVSNRTVEYDLELLIAILSWAARSRRSAAGSCSTGIR